jgi:hypothetical protein
MTSRRRGVALTPMETRRDVIVRTAVLADELGYEIFAVPEASKADRLSRHLPGSAGGHDRDHGVAPLEREPTERPGRLTGPPRTVGPEPGWRGQDRDG